MNQPTIPEEIILSKIYLIRGQKVMLDQDLAILYGVDTKQVKRQVRRNISRFPSDFMFELNEKELGILRSQSGTSSWGGTRYPPMAFTEQGVAMLSSVLTSEQAIEVNIQIMRIFTRAKEMLSMHQEILMKLQQLENRIAGHDDQITLIFESLHELLNPKNPPKRQIIGYKADNQ
jgi:hypothetical protein